MSLKDLPLRQKLIGSFLAVSALCLMVGAAGLYAISSISSLSNTMADENTPSALMLGHLSRGISDIRRVEMGIVVAKMRKDDAIFTKRIDEYRTTVIANSVDSLAARYAAMSKQPHEDAVWKQETVLITEYKNYMESQLALLSAGKVDSAVARMSTVGRQHFDTNRVMISSLEAIQADESSKGAAAITTTVRSARYELIAGMLAAVVAALALGFILNGYLGSTLALVAARADQLRSMCITNLQKGIDSLSRGELDYTVEYGTPFMHLEQKDELGALARNVDGIIKQTVETINAYHRATAALRSTIQQSQGLIEAARRGKLETRTDASQFQGGFRALVDGLNQTLDGVAVPLREAGAVLQRLAERDLSARMTGNYEGEYANMKEAINTAATNLDETLSQVQAAAEQVAAAGGQITSGSQSLAQAASEQAGSIEEVSSSLQEMAAMTKQNTDNTRIATTYAAEARESTAEGVTRMNELSSAINKIKASADQTAKIVKTIDEIAFQTNLLALNAAVEAARAGDAGKGFAVVADEVRNLAMRSAEAAKTTAALIEESVVNANGGVAMNAEVLKTLGAINTQVVKVSAVVGEIAAASEQQAQGVDQINGAVLQMNGVTQQMASGAEESASAAEELASQSNVLSDMVGQFQLTSSGVRRPKVPSRPAPVVHRTPVRVEPKPTNGKSNGNGRARLNVKAILPFDDDESLSSF